MVAKLQGQWLMHKVTVLKHLFCLQIVRIQYAEQVMAVARTLVAHEDAVLEAEASNPIQAKARELGVDPLWAPDRKAQTAAAFAAAPRFLLLDFRCAGTLGPVGHWALEALLKGHAPAIEAPQPGLCCLHKVLMWLQS